MKNNWKWLFATMFGLVLCAVLVRMVVPRQKVTADQDQDQDETENAITAPSRVSVENGQTVITLKAATQSLVGIAVAPLKETTARAQLISPATVLSGQDLVTARTNYVAAEANLEKITANTNVAQHEYERLKTLYEDQQNASQKDLQSAQGTLRSDQADEQAAQQALSLQLAGVRQNWGNTVAGWIKDNSRVLDRVFNQQQLLVEVTPPSGAVHDPPPTISLVLSRSQRIKATLISPFPRIDPRVQGSSLLYLVDGHFGLASGLNLTAHMSVGQEMRGVLIPASAVVWWQGNAWVYQESAPTRFVRRLVSTDTPLPNGLFVSTGFSPGERVVIQGAQALLSEEFRSQIQPED